MEETSVTLIPHRFTFSSNTYVYIKYRVAILYRHVQKLPGGGGSCFLYTTAMTEMHRKRSLTLCVSVHRYMSIHISVQMFLEKSWFCGLVPSALKRLLFNYVHQRSGQKSNQVINRAPAGPCAERSYSSEWPFGKELREQAEVKNRVPASLSLFTFVGKWLMFAGLWLRKTCLPSFYAFIVFQKKGKKRKWENTETRPVFLWNVYLKAPYYKEVTCHCYSNDFHLSSCCSCTPQHDRLKMKEPCSWAALSQLSGEKLISGLTRTSVKWDLKAYQRIEHTNYWIFTTYWRRDVKDHRSPL